MSFIQIKTILKYSIFELSQLAQQKFVVIKQAFESIKMEKGLMKPQDLYRS